MDDTLERLWELPAVKKAACTSEETNTEDELENEKPCDWYAGRGCINSPIVSIDWTTCICGKTAKQSDFCLSCYEGYPYAIVGTQKARRGSCKKCKLPVYMISVVPYSKKKS